MALRTFTLVAIILSFILLLLLAGTSFSRNAVWADEVFIWQDVLTKTTGKARAHYNMANAHADISCYGEAEDEYLKALDLAPDNADIRYNLAEAYATLGDKERAIEEFEYVLRLRPDDRETKEALKNIR